MEDFDNHFSTLEEVTNTNLQTKCDATLFSTVCENIRNDKAVLDVCINDLRICNYEGKELYVKCALVHKFTQNISKVIREKENELERMGVELKKQSEKIMIFEHGISKTLDELSLLEDDKERILKGFPLLREILILKIDVVQKKLDTLLETKDSYEKISFQI